MDALERYEAKQREVARAEAERQRKLGLIDGIIDRLKTEFGLTESKAEREVDKLEAEAGKLERQAGELLDEVETAET